MTHVLRRTSQVAAQRGWLQALAVQSFSTEGASSGHMGSADRFFPHAPGRNHLFVPGPCNIPERVIRAMNRPAENHRDPHFPALALSIFKDLKDMFKTESAQPFVFTGTGTGAWESAFVNTLNPGDKVVMFRYGMFSHLWVDMAQRFGLDVEILDEEWGRGADEARLEKVLEQDKEGKIKAVCVVHNETTTGVTSDIGRVREAMNSAKHNALLMVDSISGFGASDMQVDQWGVDCLIIGSQKALSLPTGLCVVSASQKALKAHETAKMSKVYYDWSDQLKTNGSGGFPYTPSLHLLYGLRETLDIAMEEGFDNQIARHARLAEGTRRAVAAWGLKNFCQDPRWYSNSLTVVSTPEGIDSNIVVNNAFTRFNLSIGIGLARVNGKVFRIGHLGDMNEISLLGAISGVEMSLLQSGVEIQPGSGVGAAAKYFQQTSQVLRGRQQYVIGQAMEQKPKVASM